MQRIQISTNQAPAAIGPYSQAIRSGQFIFTAGQVALDPASGEIVGADVQAQTHRVLQNLQAVLTSAGSSLANVVKTTVFLSSMSDFQAMNAVYATYLASPHQPVQQWLSPNYHARHSSRLNALLSSTNNKVTGENQVNAATIWRSTLERLETAPIDEVSKAWLQSAQLADAPNSGADDIDAVSLATQDKASNFI